MPIPQGFQRAKLDIAGGATIECAFNPQSYTITKANVWTYKPTQGSDLPKPEFGGGLPMSYRLSLLLDVSLDGPNNSVKDQANRLMQAMHGGGSAPKLITFSWGSVTLPRAVPMSISIQYALFQPNGEPVRAFVELELSQAEQLTPAGKAQNPTTRGITGLRAHTVAAGDTLASIAYASYGDATRWRAIAEANQIDDPMRLVRGRTLAIPRIDA